MYRCFILASLLSLGACTLPQEPAPPVAADQDATRQQIARLEEEVATLRHDLGRLNDKMEELPAWRQRIAQLEVHVGSLLTAPPPTKKLAKKAPPVPTPAQIVLAAHKEALVQPTAKGFHGGSNTQRWVWQPGKKYVVPVSPQQMTKITLPPRELLISKVFLDPDVWDVQSYRVGSEASPQDVVFIRPQEGKGAKDVDIALLTEQGHSFDVHLQVGSVGLFGVTWETPSLPQIVLDELQPRSMP